MSIPKGLAARAVIQTKDKKTRMVIEVREGNRFSNFYHTYTTYGRGRHYVVKRGIPRHRGFADSIEDVVEQITNTMKAHAKRQKVELSVRTTVRIYRKRLYRKLLHMGPDELGLSHCSNVLAEYLRRKKSTPVLSSSPSGHTPLDKRWKILTG